MSRGRAATALDATALDAAHQEFGSDKAVSADLDRCGRPCGRS
jgi:hypothetical protein